jgi:hypothetical protein
MLRGRVVWHRDRVAGRGGAASAIGASRTSIVCGRLPFVSAALRAM